METCLSTSDSRYTLFGYIVYRYPNDRHYFTYAREDIPPVPPGGELVIQSVEVVISVCDLMGAARKKAEENGIHHVVGIMYTDGD